MKQAAFERKYQQHWQDFERFIDILSRPRKHDIAAHREVGDVFAARYREVCHHLALSRSRRYSIDLQQQLNELALQGHRFMYRPRQSWLTAISAFVARDFPQTFRREWRYVALSFALFFGPLLGFTALMQWFPDLVYSILPANDVAMVESMYDPANERFGRERQSSSDTAMFGYYIYNNVGIGFRTFAGGLLFGLASVFFLLFNGIYLGAISGHLLNSPAVTTFSTFVVAHGAFELTAIGIFGAAGLMLGMALIAPGNTGRWRAAQMAARRALPLVYGATAMMLIAAFIEAYWSSTAWPGAWIKYTVGGVLWSAVFIYFWQAGRHES